MDSSVDHLVIYAVRVTSTSHGGPDDRIIDGLALVSNFACAALLTSVPVVVVCVLRHVCCKLLIVCG